MSQMWVMQQDWENMVKDVLNLLAHKQISPERAESWIWSLIEFGEATYG